MSPVRRAGFVLHQLGLAKTALLVGGVGATCAALRVLLPEDFEQPERASIALAIIRDTKASEDDRAAAAVELLELELSGGDGFAALPQAPELWPECEDTNPG